MKTIGLLGGMSPESTAAYYTMINRLANERLGANHSCRCVIYSLDFQDIVELQRGNEWEAAAELLTTASGFLVAAGADLIGLCTNTMHKVIDQVSKQVQVPILSILDAVADEATSAGIECIGLVGTRYTMEDHFYHDALVKHGLEVVVPAEHRRHQIHDAIFDELCKGHFEAPTEAMFSEVFDELAMFGAQGVALACTELELMLTTAPVQLFPSAKIHVKALLDAAMTESAPESRHIDEPTDGGTARG